MIRRLHRKQPKPARYFQSDFLERFTFSRLRTVWMVWLPIALLALLGSFYTSGKVFGASGNFMLLALATLATIFFCVLGAVRWSLLEYFLHRYPFHYSGQGEWLKKFAWYIHGIHHRQAMLRERLVVPAPWSFSFSLGSVIALLDWLLLGLLFRIGWVGLALYSGTALGYLAYDTIHWSVHSIDADWKWYKKIRSHHMRHHRSPDSRFGVSCTLWDHIFGTYPPKDKGRKNPETPKTGTFVPAEAANLRRDGQNALPWHSKAAQNGHNH